MAVGSTSPSVGTARHGLGRAQNSPETEREQEARDCEKVATPAMVHRITSGSGIYQL